MKNKHDVFALIAISVVSMATFAESLESEWATMSLVSIANPGADKPGSLAATPPSPTDRCSSLAAFQAETDKKPSATDRREALALAERYLATCGEARVVELASALMRERTIAAEFDPATSAPFAALARHIDAWAQAHGLEFRTFGDNEVWEVSLGKGSVRLAFLGHADVVEADEVCQSQESGQAAGVSGEAQATRTITCTALGWTSPPFTPTVRSGRLYGRGAQDDKGPMAAALVALAVMSEARLAPADGRIVVAIGTAEEHNWDGMFRYAATQPRPDQAIAIDSDFPVIVGESGFVAWRLKAPLAPPSRPTRALLRDAGAGAMLTQVPEKAWARIAPAPIEGREDLRRRLLAEIEREKQARRGMPFTFTLENGDGETLALNVTGVSIHSSRAEDGHNPLWPLASVLMRLTPEPNGIAAILRVIQNRFDNDHFGEKIGLAYSHPLMGRLVAAPTMLAVQDGQATLSINMRRPAGMGNTEFAGEMDAALKRLKEEINAGLSEDLKFRFLSEPVLVDAARPAVTTLLKIYREVTNETQAQPTTTRGGTYARLFPGGLSFGPSFPGQSYRGHATNEYIEMRELGLIVRMLFRAAVKLGIEMPPTSAVTAQ